MFFSTKTKGVENRQMPLVCALMPMLILLVLIMLNVIGTDIDALGGSNQLSLLVASMSAAAIAKFYGKSWTDIQNGIVSAFSSAIPAIMILLTVGMISGSWTASGVIPSMIYYGLEVMKASYFLPTVVIITSIVSLVTGSSWSTVATVGVAFLGIGRALGFSDPLIAGAIISGSYFGDKISPLSDTTNLASTIAEVDIFQHIKFMMHTTLPSIIITIIIFVIITFGIDYNSSVSCDVKVLQNQISSIFNVSPWLLLIPLFVFILIVKKMPAVPVLFIGSIIALFAVMLFQKGYMGKIGDVSSFQSVYLLLTSIMYGEIIPDTDSELLNSLFSTGGIAGMINTIWLIISAMIFAGSVQAGGFLGVITNSIIKNVKGRASLVGSTLFSCVLMNLTAGDQYMSIIVPGKMFAPSYKKMGYQPRLLSRSLEDSATVTSPLIPWNTCGATQATILGVGTFAYAPYAFFCWCSPLISFIYAVYNGGKERRYRKTE